jgi:hypothetical protein
MNTDQITLIGLDAPTVARWASFGWNVISHVEPARRSEVHRFTVEPELSTKFPIDMLRYDRCWPSQGISSEQINRTFRQLVGA